MFRTQSTAMRSKSSDRRQSSSNNARMSSSTQSCLFRLSITKSFRSPLRRRICRNRSTARRKYSKSSGTFSGSLWLKIVPRPTPAVISEYKRCPINRLSRGLEPGCNPIASKVVALRKYWPWSRNDAKSSFKQWATTRAELKIQSKGHAYLRRPKAFRIDACEQRQPRDTMCRMTSGATAEEAPSLLPACDEEAPSREEGHRGR
mmetsp:Transcript_22147/g.63507  ORF Transcript_22147/g.63507 Transcript_22147/m.63507 type:complete len:204 (+) Transcript_22147:380-991(+)